jgi:hypothetical protein
MGIVRSVLDQNRDAAGRLAETTGHLKALLVVDGAAGGQIASIAERTNRVSSTADELQHLVSQFTFAGTPGQVDAEPTPAIDPRGPAPRAPIVNSIPRAHAAGARI